MHSFDYHAPATLDEAAGLFARHGDDARALAGGTDLLVQMRGGRRRPAVLIDLKKIPDLNAIDWDPVKERITNNESANDLLHYEYRSPWKLS